MNSLNKNSSDMFNGFITPKSTDTNACLQKYIDSNFIKSYLNTISIINIDNVKWPSTDHLDNDCVHFSNNEDSGMI